MWSRTECGRSSLCGPRSQHSDVRWAIDQLVALSPLHASARARLLGDHAPPALPPRGDMIARGSHSSYAVSRTYQVRAVRGHLFKESHKPGNSVETSVEDLEVAYGNASDLAVEALGEPAGRVFSDMLKQALSTWGTTGHFSNNVYGNAVPVQPAVDLLGIGNLSIDRGNDLYNQRRREAIALLSDRRGWSTFPKAFADISTSDEIWEWVTGPLMEAIAPAVDYAGNTFLCARACRGRLPTHAPSLPAPPPPLRTWHVERTQAACEGQGAQARMQARG